MISIHALLAESDSLNINGPLKAGQISIHALLAESDRLRYFARFCRSDFYPRSPCGERLVLDEKHDKVTWISIHALLAESDDCDTVGGLNALPISIHALLAESDLQLQ